MSRITPPVPNTTLTPAYSSVSSAAGFQSGDLVYFRDSNFGTIPGNAVTSANFPVSATVSQNRMAFNTTVGWANYNPNARVGSTSSRAPSVALLTNGNIAVVFVENSGGNGAACFKIIDQNGAVVVDRTTLGFNGVSGQIGVCALTGGGFAVAAWNGTTGQISYGVFSNTGTVVAAMATDSNFGGSINALEIRTMSGGGFVIAVNQSGGNYGFRTYSAGGAGNTYTSTTGWSGDAQIVITTFSDNTFAAILPTSSTVLQVTRFNNTGGIIASSTVTSDWQSSTGYDFITLSDNSGVILNIDNDSNQYWMWARTYNQSTGAVGGRNQIAGGQTWQIVPHARPLSAGGFVVVDVWNSTGVPILRRYNSSFGEISNMYLTGLSGYVPNTTSQRGWRMTILEGATFLTIVSNGYAQSNPTFSSMPYVQVNKSNITDAGIRRGFQASQTVANISAPVSGYARAGSTPNAASFLAANNQTLTQSFPVSSGSTFALTPYVAVSDSQITHQCMTDMSNGQFVISYRSGTNASTRFTVFNPTGLAASTTVVAASGSTGISQCTCLGNGKLVVAWVPNSNDRINFSVYAANTYELLATGSTVGLSSTPSNSPSNWFGSAGYDIAPFGNDSFVVAYATNSGTGVTAAVFNDSVVFQMLANNNSHSGIQNVRVASNATGAVAVKYYSTSQGSGYVAWFFRNTTANSIYFSQTNALSSYTSQNWGEGMVMSPNGTIFAYGSNGSSRFVNRFGLNGQVTISPPGGHASNNAGVCAGQYGDFVTLLIDSGSAAWGRVSVTASQGPYGSSVVNQLYFDTANLTITNQNTNASIGSQAQIVNLYDDIYAFSYINGGNVSSGGQIVVGFICTTAASYSSAITAGVSVSSTALIPSPANGYYLAGVAASDCTAGGTGVLQVNGAATLNSQYPAGTTSQSFDFNTPALDVGVRGTISGRNVILSGGK